jgi:hypothetical protein
MVLLSGGALGFDQWVAQEAVVRKIPFELYLPCVPEIFAAFWRIPERLMLWELCKRAVSVRVVREDLAPSQIRPAVYHQRNAELVKAADVLVAFWDGRPKGGTWQTIERAIAEGKPVYNALDGMKTVQ